MPELPENFGESVIKRINREGLGIRKGSVLTNSSKTGTILSLVSWAAAIVIFSYNSYELKMNGSLELLYFGTQFLGAFLGNLPWDLIVASFVLAFLSALIMKLSGVIKRGIALTAIVIYLVTGIGGAALAASGLNDRIEAKIEAKQIEWPWLSFFHNTRAREFIHHPNFLLGKVDFIGNDSITIVTPGGNKISIRVPKQTSVREGQILRLSGKEYQSYFEAQNVHICNPNRVMRYFNHIQHHRTMKPSCCSKGKMMMH